MSTYTVQIEAGNADGTVWQALEPAESIEVEASDWTVEEVAQMTADHQTLTEGDNWRVLVWDGADADTSSPPAFILDGRQEPDQPPVVVGQDDDPRVGLPWLTSSVKDWAARYHR